MKTTKKIFFNIIAAALGLLLIAPTAGAQTTALKKAVEDIKDSVDLLIGAKDNDSESLAFRLETFNKVIELATTEAKDLKVKIIAVETDDKTIADWKDEQTDKLAGLIDYYDSVQAEIADNQKDMTVEDLKTAAQAFKDKRESAYRPIAEQANELFLVQQEGKIIETAQKRMQKIAKDIEKLKAQKIKNIKKVDAYVEKAAKSLKESAALNQKASDIFLEKINPDAVPAIQAKPAKNIEKASTSEESAAAASKIQEPSIKDLVYASLESVKGTYQTFIDLSNFVRELLK